MNLLNSSRIFPKASSRYSYVKLFTPITFDYNAPISFRLYPDSRPRNLEIASLQKGLILLVNGVELIEEGAGFGVPIVKYADKTYFSTTAELFQESDETKTVFTKVYSLDAVSRKQIQGVFINDKFYEFFHKTFEHAYLSRQNLRPVFDWAMWLRKTLGVHTQFIKVKSRGKVAVTYHCLPRKVTIKVDLSDFDKTECLKILVLNEQGATYFRKYLDTCGAVLFDRQIGAWTKVNSKQAAFFDVKNNLAFFLEPPRDVTLFRGWEQIENRFSWAGMTYSLNPNLSHFNYSIRIRYPALNYNKIY